MSKKKVTAIVTTMMMACSLFAGFTISAQDVVDVEKEPQQVVAAEDQQEVTQAPTATLSAYDDAGSKRTVMVTSDVTDTTIKVYADEEKQELLVTGTKGTGSIDVERGENEGNSSVVKALNLGIMYVTATKDGQTESDAVEVTAAARTNKTALTANVILEGTYLVAKDGGVSAVVPALPAEATVPVTYNEQTGEEGDTATGVVALTGWAWAADADSSEEGEATAEATFAAKDKIVLQGDSAAYKAQVTVSVMDDTVTAVEAFNETATYTASKAYTRGSETGLDALKAHLNANEKVVVTYETAGEQQPVATTWKLAADQEYDPKGGTYQFESAEIGGMKATISVEVTKEVAQLSENATAKELYISGLDENLGLIVKPKDEAAAIALMPKTATATFGDGNAEEYTMSWAVDEFSYGDGVQTVTDGETLGTMTRTVAVPEWVTTEPALNESPDTVTVKVDASVAGVSASAANFPEQDDDMILIKPEEQESQAMQALVVKENTVIEFYTSNEADDDEPVIEYTVTAEDAEAGKVLLQGEDISYDFPQNNAGELYVGVKIGESKTKAENRIAMTIEPEPQVTFANTNASLGIGDTINQTARLNGSTGAYTIDTATIVWESANTAVVTVGNNKSLVTTVKGIGSGNTTVTFSGEVKHPFADELEGTAPTATVEVSKAYTVTRDINGGGGGGGNRPGSSIGGGGSTVVVPSNDTYFDDIDDVAWAKDQINALAANGIINGIDERTFAPNNTVTRAEFAKMVVSAFGLFDAGATMNFTDTAGHEQDWYYPYVASAAKLGIIQGYSEDNTFRPQQTITRQDMCVMIVRACEATGRFLSSGQQTVTFSDAADIMDYAKEAVDQMTSAGIINGMGDNMFVPQGNATRAQAAKVIYDVLY